MYSRKACMLCYSSRRGRGSSFGGPLDKAGHRVAGLSAFAQPILGAWKIQGVILTCFTWLIRAQFLDALAIARAAAVCDHDAKGRLILGPNALHPNFY